MFILIMAGGSGTRFWPLSRINRPKQLLPIAGERPMVRATYERVKSLASDDRIILVVGEEQRAKTEQLFKGTGVHLLSEPRGLNTAPCIGLAAKFVEHLGGTDPMAILPADHFIANPEIFIRKLRQATEIASGGSIVTLGIVPTRPETGYGYIERGVPVAGGEEVYRVRRFVEKPNAETAAGYIVSGRFYWNAGVFVATPGTLLESLAVHMPSFHAGLLDIQPTFGTAMFAEALASLYDKTQGISFDYAVMEKTSQPICVIPCDCGWSDVGSWNSLYEVRKQDEKDTNGNVVDGEACMVDCTDSFVVSSRDRCVAALGLRKVLIVDTEDALLVIDLERSQEVKEIVACLEKSGLRHLL